jgi:hypothetical protein
MQKQGKYGEPWDMIDATSLPKTYADRAKASVNATAGIPTEALDAGVISRMASELSAFKESLLTSDEGRPDTDEVTCYIQLGRLRRIYAILAELEPK